MKDIVLISYTGLNAGGGVPRWNRDFVAGFPGTRHYCWESIFAENPSFAKVDNIPEWDKAKILNQWLIWSKRVTKDSIIIVDGFWGLGLEDYNVISVAHGIWSHLTKEDVQAGKQPEFPVHHNIQVNYRRDHLARGGKIVAVSRFIREQMNVQWGFHSHVINNAIDLERFGRPAGQKIPNWTDRRLVIHGVTTANKGFEHIEAVQKALPDDDVFLLDHASKHLQVEKYVALANADLVVQPSAYEGNSYFVLETLACDVPIVAYSVGLLHSISEIAKENGIQACIGGIIDRKYRSPEETAKVTKFILESVVRDRNQYNPRKVAELFSIEKFHSEWRSYLESL